VTLDWLVARPIAHRGLHDRAAGLIENSFEAADAAIALGCAIECDIQMSADGEAFVFHDYELERLTGAPGEIGAMNAADLSKLSLQHARGAGSIPTLTAFLEHVAGRAPVIIEIKSRFDGDMRLAERAARIVQEHAGAVALKSFDPSIIAHLRRAGVGARTPLGIVTEASFDHPEWDALAAETKQSMACLLHWRETQPDFLSFYVRDLPNAAVHLARTALNLPVMTWTVRTPAQWDIARRHADQAIFEGALP
jgi:glycerophosphoryl diester phosphodiesterase